MTNTQAGTLVGLQINWDSIMAEWSPHITSEKPGKTAFALKPLDDTKISLLKEYEKQGRVPFYAFRINKYYFRGGSHPSIDPQTEFVEKYPAFTLRILSADGIWYMPPQAEKITEIRRAPFIEFEHPDGTLKKEMKLYFFERDSRLFVLDRKDIIYFPKLPMVPASLIPKESRLYLSEHGKGETGTGIAPKYEIQGPQGKKEFYLTPDGYTSYAVSRQKVPNWQQDFTSTLDPIYAK